MLDLNTLLRPASVVVIGASAKGGPGTVAATNLLNFFTGDTYLINPRAPEVLGRRTYASVADLPAVPDVAVVALSGSPAEQAVHEARAVGVERFVGIADMPTDVSLPQVVGGNCLGYMNFIDNAHLCIHDLTDFMNPPRRGGVGVVSQSGGLLLALMNGALRRNIGFSWCISSGVEQVLGVEDYLEWLIDSPETEVIALVLEGPRDGPRFLRGVSEAVRRGKPVVVFRLGRSSRGKVSVTAHTGKLASDDVVTDSLVKQFGGIVVGDLAEMLETLVALAGFAGRWPHGRRVGATMISGGAAALVADFAELNKLELPPLTATTVERLERVLPDAAHVDNPLDISGGSSVLNPQTTLLALDALAESGSFDAVIYVAPTRATGGPRFTKALMGEVMRHAPDVAVPELVICPNPDAITEHWSSVLQGTKTVALHEIRAAMAALGHTCDFAAASTREQKRSEDQPTARPAPTEASDTPLDRAELLRAGIPVVNEFELHESTLDEQFVGAGSPVAVKVLSPSVPHKAEAMALRLGVDGPNELHAAFSELRRHAHEQAWSDVRIVAQPMVSFDREYIISAIRDATFGATLVVGVGGSVVELIPDTSVILSADFTADDLDRVLADSVVGKLMSGYRGASRVERTQLLHLLNGMAALMARFESARVIELNPVVVDTDTGHLVALDYLVE